MLAARLPLKKANSAFLVGRAQDDEDVGDLIVATISFMTKEGVLD